MQDERSRLHQVEDGAGRAAPGTHTSRLTDVIAAAALAAAQRAVAEQPACAGLDTERFYPSTDSPDGGGPPDRSEQRPLGLLMTVEQVAELWFGEGGSTSATRARIRRLIPDTLPARKVGNRWFVHRATAESWAAGCDPASVMAHPDTRRWSA